MCKILWSSLVLALAMGTYSSGQDLAGIKCVMNGDAQASAEAYVDYLDGKVYFCCDNCAAKFKEEMKKPKSAFAIKANHQLLLTGQYVQKACPITGKPVAADKTQDVGGVTVGLCCAGCVAKVEKADGLAKKANLVFAKKPFKKGFERKRAEISLGNVKCLIKTGSPVSEKFSADYKGRQVFFCCNGCKGKFEKDPSAFTTQANFQLVASGQVSQVACPFSGGDLADDQSSEVGGVILKYCCGKCKAKMEHADETKQMEFAFGEKGFKKGFEQE